MIIPMSRIRRNEPLKKHTTIRLGGLAEKMILCETKNELITAAKMLMSNGEPFHLLGNGSNVAFDDIVHRKTILKHCSSKEGTEVLDKEHIRFDAHMKLSHVISFLRKRNLYCMPFLSFVPGTVGGAIYMNAGRGKPHNLTISKYLVSVEVLKEDKVVNLSKMDCRFEHRRSIFQKNNWIILSALFKLPRRSASMSLKEIKERKKYVLLNQDLSWPSAGTIFSEGYVLAEELRGYQVGGLKFSELSPHFIINTGGGSFLDLKLLIRHAIEKHKQRKMKSPRLEIQLID